MNSVLKWWTSENSRTALRAKQLASFIIPELVLTALKKRYYFGLVKSKRYESEKEMRALPHVVKAGDFVIDIGASIGSYTDILASLVGNTGLVWSIEPVPQTFEILRYLISRSGWQNVTGLSVAISDQPGNVELEIPHWKGGGEAWYGARIFSPQTRHPNWRVVAAKAVTLDSLTENSDRPVTFIKCDTEFHELACLRGAVNTLAKWHPALLIETLDDFHSKTSDAENIARFLRDFGYEGFLFDGQRFRPRSPNEKSQNAFFIWSQSPARP